MSCNWNPHNQQHGHSGRQSCDGSKRATHHRSLLLANPSYYGLLGFLRRGPYNNSSANSGHLYSRSRAFFSTWRYSGILIFQAREKTLGSSLVPPEFGVSALPAQERSTTCTPSLAKLPSSPTQTS